MLITLDCGNTQTIIAIFNYAFENFEILAQSNIPTEKLMNPQELRGALSRLLLYVSADELRGALSQDRQKLFKLAIYSSVVPERNSVIEETLCSVAENVVRAGVHIQTGLKIAYDEPEKLGIDRFVNAVFAFYQFKSPVLVVDMGTATTVTAVDEDGVLRGGLIMPGVQTASKALFDATAQLPNVMIKVSKDVIATNPVDALSAGNYFLHLYGMQGIITEVKKQAKMKGVVVIGTGGNVGLFEEAKIFDIVDQGFTLKGLKFFQRFYERENDEV